MNKKYIGLVVLGLAIAVTTYLAYNSLSELEDFDFSDPFETDFDDN